MNLESFLRERGFRRIELTKNAAEHFETSGTVNDRPVTVIIDTGAGATLISLDLVKELGLSTEEMSEGAAGAGGAGLAIFKVSGATLRIGELEPRIDELIAMDLSHVNDGLAVKGCGPVDAILGANVFETHSAVIDYGSSSLFLKI